MPQIRPTTVNIDLKRLVDNLAVVRGLQPPGTRILCPVKGDAYGHGLVACARALEQAGAEWFGVALVEEGRTLRAAGVQAPILCLGGIGGRAKAAEEILAHGLTPMVFDLDSARALNAAAHARGQRLPIHLKVDTGMGRLGVLPMGWPDFLEQVGALHALEVQGLATHFASAEDDPAFTQLQATRFREAVALARAQGHTPSLIHAANSAGATLYDDLAFNMVRPGLALYGHAPEGRVEGLMPVMQVFTEVLFVKTLPEGHSVSYGRRWTSSAPTRLATLPVGYADGYPRSLGNKAHVAIHGQRCPIRGAVCMDLCLVDVSALDREVRAGDLVELLGDQIPAEELAAHAGTIVYEILTGLSERVPRRHQRGQEGTEPHPG